MQNDPTRNADGKRKIVCVVGQGYVGLPLAIAAESAGYFVVGYDTDRAKVDGLSAYRSPIEDVTTEMLMQADGYTAVHSIDAVPVVHGRVPDIWVVTVPTPLKDGQPDNGYVISAAFDVAQCLKPGKLVVLESTVAPGTTQGVFAGAIDQKSAYVPGQDYHLAFSPERIDPGNVKYDFSSTNKLVAGHDPDALEAALEFYDSILQPGMAEPVSSIQVAETAKLLENTFRHVNIALVNELAQHCHRLDINVWDVIAAASTKPYGFMPFWPGPGVGGHCLPVDPAYLGDRVQRETGHEFNFVKLAMQINDHQPQYVVERAGLALNEQAKSVKGSAILLLGYAYKPDTADCRETPARDIMERLTSLGARVDVFDPLVGEPISKLHMGKIGLLEYDLIISITPHTCFTGFNADVVNSGVLLLDTRNTFPNAPHIIKL